MAYKHDFDKFYQNHFQHSADLDTQRLLLDHYPYSLDLQLPPRGMWLECGIGSGRVVWRHRDTLLSKGQVVGFDYSEAALRVARELLPPEVMMVKGDIQNLCFSEESFDLITAFGTVQAVPKSRWWQVVGDLLRLLKVGGTLGFSVHPFNFLEMLRCLPSPGLLANMVTKKQLARMLDRHGLAGAYTIEEAHIFLMVEKLYQLMGRRLPLFWGFRELPDTPAARRLTGLFTKYFPQLTVGHYWVTMRKDRRLDFSG